VTVASPVGNARCAVTPEAVAAATIQWNMQVYGGNPTIKAGEAVAFITSLSHKPTVTEGTPAHTAVPQPCVDKELLAGRPLVVTFYKPGVYHLFCRKLPPAMNTVVTVQ
jgi:plastocyanin